MQLVKNKAQANMIENWSDVMYYCTRICEGATAAQTIKKVSIITKGRKVEHKHHNGARDGLEEKNKK